MLAVKLAWDMATLKQVNWKNIEDWQLTELAGIEGLGPFGRKAIEPTARKAGIPTVSISASGQGTSRLDG